MYLKYDQLFGQTWAHLNNLEYIYPEEQAQKTMQSIWKYNWTPDVASQNKVHPLLKYKRAF